jgi:hypothetical protein
MERCYDNLFLDWQAPWVMGPPPVHFPQASAAVSMIFSELMPGFR